MAETADRLEHDPELRARLETLHRSLLQDPRIDQALTGLVTSGIRRFREQVRVPGSPIEDRLVGAILEVARRVRDEPAVRLRIEQSIETTMNRAIALFGDDIDALVTGTISHWDAARTADQLELLLGPDLQYIRINGAVVGGLAGLLIHAIAQGIG
jgi:uncharacterized membrane-anchored protein YjiN (DUF445 family)